MAQVLQEGPDAVVITFIILLTLLIIVWLLRRRSPAGPGDGGDYWDAPAPSIEPRAFAPRQFLLHLEHRAEGINAEAVNGLLGQWLKGAEKAVSVAPGDSITTFEIGDGNFRSIVVVSAAAEDAELFSIIATLNSTEPIGDVTGRAGPNWLTSATDGRGSVTGGPGTTPIELSQTAAASLQVQQIINGRTRNITPPQNWGDGDGVNVAILDTLPSLHALADAYLREEPKIPAGGAHRLIRQLLDPDPSQSRVHFYPAAYDVLAGIGDYRADCHEYRMADHGLFIAGVIRDIVPKARLHLIEVMSEYGVGNTASLVKGLAKLRKLIQDCDPQQPWVVNCSFVFSLPDCGHPEMVQHLPFDEKIRNQLAEYLEACKNQDEAPADIEENIALLKAFITQTEALFNMIHTVEKAGHRICVIAAAGNDGQGDCDDPNAQRPSRQPARYPAAFDSIIGVAALDKSQHPASYSNRADERPSEGFSVFGGEEGEPKGVLGLYLDDFPIQRRLVSSAGSSEAKPVWRYRSNTSGWAWWAGTSFAAPMISGMAAAILGTPPTIPVAAIEQVKAALAPHVRVNGTDPDRIIVVTQP